MKKEPSIVRGLFEHSEESSLEAPGSGNWATLSCRTKTRRIERPAWLVWIRQTVDQETKL